VRNRYFDLLRAIAIFRVVVYHATELAFLSIVFPAMGTMFALGGSLMAASLDRKGWKALYGRLHRLLPPLWIVAILFVPAMVFTGLTVDWHLIYWVIPLGDPPMNWWGYGALLTLWYLREYLWFILISPVALWLFRRWPIPTIAFPLVLLVAYEFGLPLPVVAKDFAQYFACWLLGFAHHEGMLQRMRKSVLLGIAGAMGAAGVAWFLTHPGPKGLQLGDIALGDGLWSCAFVLVLLGLAPATIEWVDRWRPLSRLITILNSRAMTVYLWHKAVIIGVGTIIGFTWWQRGPGQLTLWLAAIFAGVGLCVLLFGWAEDIAARRRAVLVPAVQQWAGARSPSSLPGRRVGAARAEARGV